MPRTLIGTKHYVTMFAIISSLLGGCADNQEPFKGRWTLGNVDIWLPLQANGHNMYLNGHRAFLNNASMIVDCNGRGIKMGSLHVFAHSNGLFYLYDGESKAIRRSMTPYEMFDTRFGKLERGSNITTYSLEIGNKNRAVCNQHSKLSPTAIPKKEI